MTKVSLKILNSGIILKSLEGHDMVNVLKIWNTFLFLFSSKIFDIRAGTHANGKEPDQTASKEAV